MSKKVISWCTAKPF